MNDHHDLAESAEERSELFETLLEAIGVPFLVVGASLRVLFFSQQAASLFSLSFSDIGHRLAEVLPPHIAPRAERGVEEAMATRRLSRRELRSDSGFAYAQRAQVLETPQGSPAGAVLTYLQSSAQSSSHRPFDALFDLYESMLSHVPDQIARLDRGRRFVYVNDAAAAVAEHEVEDMLGSTAEELDLAGTLGEIYTAEAEYAVVTGNQVSEIVELPLGGRHVDIWWRLIPESNDLGSVASVLSIATELTELPERRRHRLQPAE